MFRRFDQSLAFPLVLVDVASFAPALVLLPAVLVGCSGTPGVLVSNQLPGVAITGGIVQVPPGRGVRDSVSYSAEILWAGWDPDGVVDHYQYTIDVPDDLLDQVNDPEETRIAWRDTTAFRASFLFQTPVQDSLLGEPIARFRGDHTFYIRAVDDRGEVSRADYVAFTAVNFTPRTLITSPPAASSGALLSIGKSFNVCWEGLDPDSPDPAHRPVLYEWKIKQMPKEWIPLGDAQYCVDVLAADVPWIRTSADTTCLRLSLQTGFPYIFAVRGIDEAGGTETFFVMGSNTLLLDAKAGNPATPLLTVSSAELGIAEFPGPVVEMETTLGRCLYFDLLGDASAFGGAVQGYDWGLDVDPDDEEGLNGLTLSRRAGPFCFDTPGLHTVVVRCRDTGGGVTTGVIVVRAVVLSFDRDLLYVDDFRRSISQGFRDADQDRRNKEMLAAAGIPVDDPTRFRHFDAWGSNDEQSDPTLLRLSDLAAYRMVYWDVLGVGVSRNPALVNANACPTGKILQAYVAGGGVLWVSGQTVFGPFDTATGEICVANLGYAYGEDNIGLNFVSGDFLYDFMNIVNGGVKNVRNAQDVNGLIGANPEPDLVAEGFPMLAVDRTVFRPTGGINACDIATALQADPTGGLEPMYTHVSAVATSGTNRKVNALRYHDPDPVPRQGPVAVSGFPIFFLQQGSVSEATGSFEMARLMIEWFRGEQDRYFATHRPPEAH